MLILPESVHRSNHEEAKLGMIQYFNSKLEKILSENSKKDLYWVLGKVKIHDEKGKSLARPYLQAMDAKPPLIKESFVYEVDNKRGVKTLLWVMNPDNTLTFPTLNKTISVADKRA